MNERLDKLRASDAPERRAIAVSDFELRKNGDHLALDGYASVFNKPYELYGGADKGGWDEVVHRSAFDVTLREKPDLHLLINHEGMPLARTKSGTLHLSTDSTGLRVKAPDLDRRDPDVQRLEVKMERGDMDEMSFAFRVKTDEFDEDKGLRTLKEVSLHKGDVSVVNFGANPATSVKMRSLADALGYLCDVDAEEALAEMRSAGGDLRSRVEAARLELARLLRESAPDEKRTLSLADARALLDA